MKPIVRHARLLLISLCIWLTGFAHGQSLPDAPHATPRAFWAVAGAETAAAYLDAYSTEKLFRVRPQAYEGENPWLYGHRAGTAREYATMTAEAAAMNLFSYFLLRHHRRYWFAPSAADAAAHLGASIHNLRLVRQDEKAGQP